MHNISKFHLQYSIDRFVNRDGSDFLRIYKLFKYKLCKILIIGSQ